MEKGWNFPLNNDGAEVGLNDAGIETFRGHRFEALAREINQNSCDARKDDNKPVEVHFNLHKMPIELFPDRKQYMDILDSCLSYWSHIDKSKKFFNNAIEIMKQDYINVLKISDYNTTGLTGASLDRGGNWNSLIKAVGVSNKDSNAGGSFGIGKHAPFACSSLRTVFYGTKAEDGTCAFQGVGKLATHLKGDKATQGTGYFGITEKNKPILDSYSDLGDFYHRDQIGTDIFVMGFNGEDSWETSIIKSVLESFFYSIHEGRLVVQVGEVRIESSTLASLLEEYTKDDPECLSYQYYQAITNGVKHEVNLKNTDEIILYLLEGKKLPKKVAMVRGTGMKIFDKGHFRGLTKFAGVMVAKGNAINKLLRSIEPPSHDSWQPERFEDNVRFAKKVLKELNDWINEKVRDLSDLGNVEELDIEGMSQYLPDDANDVPLNNSDKEKDDLPAKPLPVNIEKVPLKNNFEAKTVTSIGVKNIGDEDEADVDTPNPKNKESENKGGKSSTKKEEKGSSKSSGIGENPEGDDKKPTGDVNAKPPLELKGFRSTCINPKEGIYRISFTPSRNGTGYIVVNIAGEQGKEVVGINEAKILSNNTQLSIKSQNQIGPMEFSENNREIITISLNEKIRCALGVVMYES
jgi:hypothetical protein